MVLKKTPYNSTSLMLNNAQCTCRFPFLSFIFLVKFLNILLDSFHSCKIIILIPLISLSLCVYKEVILLTLKYTEFFVLEIKTK
jgi:hypothetical protein